MTRQFSDDDIVALYKDGANEEPSELIDARILRYAEKQSKQTAKYPWWQITGIAATVGFVAILAPWKWADKPLSTEPAVIQESLEAEMLMDAAPADAALPEPPKVEMKTRSNAETFERFSRAPEHDEEPLSDAEIRSKIEAKLKFIQILIDNDKTEMATQQLRILLRTYPQAKEELTEEMRELVNK